MAVTIDHLAVDHLVRVLRAFRDARGQSHDVGELAVLRRIEVDWQRQEISIEWERDKRMETLHFNLSAKEGPRSGVMREFFEMEERVPLFEDTREGRMAQQRLALQSAVPDLIEQPVLLADQYDVAIARVWALAARRRFADAEHQIQLILTARGEERGRLQRAAESLENLAAAYVVEGGDVYAWLRDRAIDLWYGWGSQATSGGEGGAMSVRIREAERRLPEPSALGSSG